MPTDIGIQLTASSDVDRWINGWEVAGVFIGATNELPPDPAALLDDRDFSGSCDYAGRDVYQDPLYSGVQDVWTDCGGIGATFIIVAAVPADGAFIVEVQATLVAEADFEALDRLLASFVVDPPG